MDAEGRYVLVEDSPDRTEAVRENSANYYGRLFYVSDEERLPVTCVHGGSMWLCAGCAEAVLRDQPD